MEIHARVLGWLSSARKGAAQARKPLGLGSGGRARCWESGEMKKGAKSLKTNKRAKTAKRNRIYVLENKRSREMTDSTPVMISITYAGPRKTFRFAWRNEGSFWPFLGLVEARTTMARPAVRARPSDDLIHRPHPEAPFAGKQRASKDGLGSARDSGPLRRGLERPSTRRLRRRLRTRSGGSGLAITSARKSALKAMKSLSRVNLCAGRVRS